MKDILLMMVFGYVMGNIQTSYILGRLIYKVDIRKLGHGNAGASNAIDSIGWKFGLAVATIDVAKGLITILIVKSFYQIGFNAEGALLLYIAGYSAVLGHIFPFFMKFKGGKGTATLIGILMGFNPWFGIIGILVVIGITVITDFVSVSALFLALYIIGLTVYYDLGIVPILISIGGAVLSVMLHLPNYRRIVKGNEGRLSLVLKKLKKSKGEQL
jgi:acyl phosphate:glycerol-3-phosphate acyltransferase